jgi:hypothetical protein
VLVAAACVLGSARLWADALTPAAVPFVEPLTSSGSPLNALPRTVVVATAEPRVRHGAPNVVRRTHAKAAPVAIPRAKVSAPAQAAAASTPQTPPTTAPPVQPPKAKPPVTPPAAAPQPSPPAPAAPSAPVVQVAAASAPPPPAPPPVEPPAAQPSDSRPGHGYGDKNHTHSGPPGQQGS